MTKTDTKTIKEKLKEYYATLKLINLKEKEIKNLQDILNNYKRLNLKTDIQAINYTTIPSKEKHLTSYIDNQIETKYTNIENQIEEKQNEILSLSYKIIKIEVLIDSLSNYNKNLIKLIYQDKKSLRQISYLLNESKGNISRKHINILEYLTTYIKDI